MAIAPDLRGAALDGRYELEELIGEGAFGRVYRGRDRRLERAVAIKVVKPWWAEDPEWVAVFEREARLLARVNHPGIVQIHDVGQCADGLYYVSELVAGEDLAARLRRAEGLGLPAAEARSLALGLCAALEGAHAEGIVHRDVKPANVLISDGRVDGSQAPALVKVADFGVARLAESTEDGASVIVGTPRYMAPEQADGGRSPPPPTSTRSARSSTRCSPAGPRSTAGPRSSSRCATATTRCRRCRCMSTRSSSGSCSPRSPSDRRTATRMRGRWGRRSRAPAAPRAGR